MGFSPSKAMIGLIPSAGLSLKRRDDRGEKRFVAKGNANARADDDLIGHRLGHAVIQLATDRAVDDDSDEGGHAEI